MAKSSTSRQQDQAKFRLAPRARHDGYTQVSNGVIYDRSLSPQARLLYAMFYDFATFTHEEPEQKEIAANLGCTDKTLRGYISELTKAGLVESVRRGRGLTNAYVVYTPDNKKDVENGKNYRSGSVADDRSGTVTITDPTRARSLPEDKSEDLEKASPSPGEVVPKSAPNVVLVNGQNLGFNALEKATGAGRGASRTTAAALNGSKGVGPGIRDLYAADNPPPGDAGMRELWEAGLAKEIERRAKQYRQVMPPGSMLTPMALRKWWDRVVHEQQSDLPDYNEGTVVV